MLNVPKGSCGGKPRLRIGALLPEGEGQDEGERHTPVQVRLKFHWIAPNGDEKPSLVTAFRAASMELVGGEEVLY